MSQSTRERPTSVISPDLSSAILRPSGEPFGNRQINPDVSVTVDAIDDTIARAVSEIAVGGSGIVAETATFRTAVGDTSELDLGETHGLPEELAREKYNRSLRTLRILGRLARSGGLRSEAGKAAYENVRRDLTTSLAEMYENGEAFRGGFEISDIYDYPIANGQVQHVTGDGLKPIRQTVAEGAAVSAAAAKADRLMLPQAQRDAADVYNAARVDDISAQRLGSVNTRLTVSRDLGEVIRPGSPARELYIGKGYREGLTFIQLYFADGDKLTAGTFSVDGVSDQVFNAVLAKHGTIVPTGGSRHDSVKHGVELTLPNKAAAVAFALQFRKECYALQRDTRERRSASQFIAERQAAINSYIDALCLPLAISIDAETKDSALHDFVDNLLRKPDNMKPEVVEHLRTIHRSGNFTAQNGRFMASVTLYAIAEALYQDALRFVSGKLQFSTQRDLQIIPVYENGIHNHQQILLNLVHNVHTGVEAGRSYDGSCPGSIRLSNRTGDDLQDSLNPQGAFGGREGDDKESVGSADRRNWKMKWQRCEVKSCPNATRVVKCGPCGVCMERCQEQYYDRGLDPSK